MRHRSTARLGVLAAAILMVAAACGGGTDVDEASGGSTTVPSATNAACEGATLTAPEIGVTDKTITVTVIADTGSPIRPGLFQGSVDGVKAWAEYMNAEKGGLACRQIVVKEADSKLSGEDAKNAIAAACGNSVALVGTTALFLDDISGLESCKDKTGATTGLPDFAELQTVPAHQCSEVSFAALPNSASCPYSGEGPRTFTVGYTQYDYYLNKHGQDALHGVFVVPKDLPSTISASMPIFRAENQMGIKSDAEFGKSGLDTQPAYTEVAQAIKQNNSTYGRNGLDYQGSVLMRKEAEAQGVDSVLVWDCSLQCYDKRMITEGGGATEGHYVWLNFLPLEDGDANPELAAFLKYNEKPDGFGVQSWVAGQIFAQAVNDAIAANGNDPNAITRANILEGVRNLHEFDANGLIPTIDPGGRKGSVCLVGMQIQGDKFVRVSPLEPGTFDCGNNKAPLELTIDPLAEFKG
jgi:hypothetical protein